MSGFTRVIAVYHLEVSAHRVEPRFDIPASTHELYARSRRAAIREVVYRVTRGLDMGHWKPWLREVAAHTRIVSAEERKVAGR